MAAFWPGVLIQDCWGFGIWQRRTQRLHARVPARSVVLPFRRIVGFWPQRTRVTTSRCGAFRKVRCCELWLGMVRKSRRWPSHLMADHWPAAALTMLSCFGILQAKGRPIPSPTSACLTLTGLSCRFFLQTDETWQLSPVKVRQADVGE